MSAGRSPAGYKKNPGKLAAMSSSPFTLSLRIFEELNDANCASKRKRLDPTPNGLRRESSFFFSGARALQQC